MTRYLIAAEGCDDSTQVVVELTDDQAEGVRLAAAAIDPYSGGCKAGLSIKPATKPLPYWVDNKADHPDLTEES